MSPEELQLECMKLAVELARREATTELRRVAELQTWFYNHVAVTPAKLSPETKTAGKGSKATDKSPDPFA